MRNVKKQREINTVNNVDDKCVSFKDIVEEQNKVNNFRKMKENYYNEKSDDYDGFDDEDDDDDDFYGDNDY